MTNPHVDVLLVNYLTGELTHDAIRAVSGPGNHVFVLDNSGDVPADTAALHDVEVITSPENCYYARGNNLLFDRCDGPHVLLLNPDVLCTYETVRALTAVLERDDRAWGVVPRLLNPDGSDQPYYRRFPTTISMLCDRVPPLRRLFRRSWERHVYADLDASRRQRVDSPPGACILLRRDRVGTHLFNEDYPLFFNDTDLALRLTAAGGYCLLVPEERVVHQRGASLQQERNRQPWAMSLSYDYSAREYARRHVRGWPLVAAVCSVRISIASLLSSVDQRRTARG